MASRTEKKRNPEILLTVTLLLIFLLTSRTPQDADMWWHLRAGETMLTQKAILLHDVFSYTRYGETWVNAFWISDLWMALLFRVGGFFALAVWVAAMAALVSWILALQMPKGFLLNSLVLLLTALVFAPVWTPRPQLFSFLLLALLDFWLFKYFREDARGEWILLPLFALWANLHGGFIWGILLLLAATVGAWLDRLFGLPDSLSARKNKRLFLFSLLAAAAVLFNPNGAALWKLPFHTVDVSLAFIQEWLSPNFHHVGVHPFLWMIFLTLFAFALSAKAVSFSDLLKFSGFAYMAFVSQRNLAPFAIVAAPILSRALADAWEMRKDSPLGDFLLRLGDSADGKEIAPLAATLLNAALILLLLGAAFGRLYLLSLPARVNAGYPLDAVAWLKENRPQGRLFNPYNWGGYLLWTLPEYPVFIDGRADLYGDEIISQWWDVTEGGEEAWKILDAWDVRLILLDAGWAIESDLPSHGWRLVYRDETSAIYSLEGAP